MRHTNLLTPYDAIKAQVNSLNGRVQFLFDNDKIAGAFNTIYPTPQACLLVLKSYATEGLDRPSIDLHWNATQAVESTAAMCPNTIVVTHGAGVDLLPWADNENVTAILAAQYPGEETGNVIVDVLWGAVEPSGRLPFTIPYNESDYGPPIVEDVQNPTDSDSWFTECTESEIIDYRHFDMEDIAPRYEFGFGLSYTSFSMSDGIEVQVINSPVAARA